MSQPNDDMPDDVSARILLEEAAYAVRLEMNRVDADFVELSRRLREPGADRRAIMRQFWDDNPDYAPRIICWTP